ncbi:ParA family partition ATPase [Merismopedia glauca]|uniref:Cobyrinic acid a,c-diamide synthase n=1 Tax=Merismopedia glauca CCAP 1448/3 TaxID=1296344 RepID=A0A2T1C4A5_9CYAN|nr:ParA family partition ATPase [Merismopedia glauca]PSB03115.1 cobyrinic acid a,c-diamide synthase [Merismopedia glauca CCAP 1448/3]
MAAQVIAVVNQKGGAGKTTVSMNLAGSFANRSHKVLVVDADPQGTATRWAASASDDQLFPASVIGLSAANTKVHREVKKFIDDYDWIIIDCPPAADSPVPQSALLIADLALVPLIPSPLDMWAAVGIREVIHNVSGINETLKARLVLNQYQGNTSLAKEALNILSEFGIELCQTRIASRQVYRQSAVFGRAVQGFGAKGKEAIDEIESLTDELVKVLERTAIIDG